MQIRLEKNKITYVFRDKNIDFDFGMMIINQLSLPISLPGKKISKKGKEGFEAPLKGYSLLIDVLPNIGVLQNIKCITTIFDTILKIEDLELVSKYGIWCKYEHLFYDEKNDCLKTAVLPLSEDIDYEDGYNFEERLQETVSFLAGYLPFNIQKEVIEITEQYAKRQITAKEAVNALKNIANDDIEVEKAVVEENKEKNLTLIYLRNDELQEFEMEKDEILIGKNLGNVDIDFSESRAVSRLHCKLMKQNQSYFVQDLDSTNHTLVNGERVPAYEYMELEDRDLITLGDIEIRVSLH